jgi:hypothetical protein
MLAPGSFGHGGAYGTQAWIDPVKNLIYILMVQRANFPNSDASEVRKGFQETVSRLFASKPDEAGFEPIFDGKTLKGWHASAKTGHSQASGHRSGGRWVAEDGAIVGSQDIKGNGGILITDSSFGDFEIALEMRNDFGPDSGFQIHGNHRHRKASPG